MAQVPFRVSEALDCFRQAQVIHREIGDRQGAAQTLNSLALALRDADQPDAARECWRQALALFEDLNDPQATKIRACLNNLDPDFSV